MAETADKNMIDKDEYPQTAEIEARCVNILADLWNAPEHESATGCSTTGSSEAAMLAGMALKWRWRERMQSRRQADRPAEPGHGRQRPGLLGEVLPLLGGRAAAGADGGRDATTSPPSGRSAHCDENTIGVVAILGSTFDGSYEPVKEIADALDQLERDRGIDIPMHVDAASGGFVAPFLRPGPGVGLPAPAGAVDQRLGAQVRARLPGRRLGDLARQGGAAAATWSSTSTTSAATCRRSR